MNSQSNKERSVGWRALGPINKIIPPWVGHVPGLGRKNSMIVGIAHVAILVRDMKR